MLNSGTLEPFEEDLLRRLQSERTEDLNELVKLLVIGPNFEQRLDKEIRNLLDWDFEGAVDGYLACMGALALKMGLLKDGNLESNIHRGALAVSKLRSAPGPSPTELKPWIIFGLSIVTFAMTALGTGATTVRRHVLKPIASLPELSEEIKACDSLTCLVVFETWECLTKRSIPLLRLDPGSASHVDRLFGVTAGLLPHFYDICELSNALQHADTTDCSDVLEALTIVEREVETWQPRLPSDFVSEFTTIEVVHIMAQAELHKVAALLFIHRLRNPFGSEDDAAERLSRRIMGELRRAQVVTNQRVRCISFPFFLAAVDTRSGEDRAQILDLSHDHIDPTCPNVCDQFRDFMTALWQIRDASSGFIWLDLMPHLPPLTMTI